jgi:hypothetical protein
MTALVLVGFLMHQSAAVREPAITLRLLAADKPTARAEHGNADEMSVVVKANRAGDVWVDRNALHLEIRGLDGAPLRSRCIVDRDRDLALEPRRPDEVRLRAGQTMTIRLTVGQSAADARGAVFASVPTSTLVESLGSSLCTPLRTLSRFGCALEMERRHW